MAYGRTRKICLKRAGNAVQDIALGTMNNFEKSVFFPVSVDEVFSYHICMDNISKLLPRYINLEVLNAPCDLKLGGIIQLRVYMYGVSFFWEAEIIEYKQNIRFTDSLNHGPFSFWKHYHLFKACKGGTLMTDRIEYKLPWSILGEIAHYFFGREKLEQIFITRHKKALEYLRPNY